MLWPAPPEQPRFIFEATLRNGASLHAADASPLKRLLAGEEDDARASFGKPFAVAAGQGRVFVTDTEGRRVFVFDVPRRRTYSFGLRFEGQLKRPAGIALDGRGRVYVVDSIARRVVVYDALGLYLGHIDGAPWWVRPTAVAVEPSGARVHVVDTGGVESDSHLVFTHEAQGRLVRRLGRRGAGDGEFNLPSDAAVGPGGTLWVLDAGNFRVQAFSPEGRFLRAFGSAGNGIGQMARPRGLAVDAEGLVYVADAMLANVQVFDAHGVLLLPLGARAMHDAPGRWALPARLACDETARLYVVDQYLHKVEVLRKLADDEGRRWQRAAAAG
ncbi:MAG: 6-bladed beta-propeller [Rubrivivax sp.]|nr:6-bladed beta-propeller [Rubrivivax sp.]